MCQSCIDEHHKTLKDLEGHVDEGMGMWIFIGCILLGLWAPLITGCYTEHGCGHFCCLAILMWTASIAGYVWVIVWGYTVWENAKREHHEKRDVAEEEPLT